MDEFAKELSHKLHATQFRNDGRTPYTVHTDYVGERAAYYLERYLGKPSPSDIVRVRAAGFLHDCLEDHQYTNITSDKHLSYLGEEYNNWNEICYDVLTLSRFSKDEPIVDYLYRIKQNPYARAVKLADLEHNLSDLRPGNLRDKYHLCQDYLIRGI